MGATAIGESGRGFGAGLAGRLAGFAPIAFDFLDKLFGLTIWLRYTRKIGLASGIANSALIGEFPGI